jgi:hypothetical protein
VRRLPLAPVVEDLLDRRDLDLLTEARAELPQHGVTLQSASSARITR